MFHYVRPKHCFHHCHNPPVVIKGHQIGFTGATLYLMKNTKIGYKVSHYYYYLQ